MLVHFVIVEIPYYRPLSSFCPRFLLSLHPSHYLQHVSHLQVGLTLSFIQQINQINTSRVCNKHSVGKHIKLTKIHACFKVYYNTRVFFYLSAICRSALQSEPQQQLTVLQANFNWCIKVGFQLVSEHFFYLCNSHKLLAIGH